MKTFEQLTEGVYDPNIFKAFFLAGGPGSGKSYVVRRTTGGLGLKIVNSDIAFEKLLNDADFDLDFRAMSPEKSLERDKIRSRAKEITSKMQRNFVAGRLGLIIDGTGAEYVKIERQARKLKELGYESIFDYNKEKSDNLDWFYHLTGGHTHTDFFAIRPTDYSKANEGEDWDDLF